MTTATTISSILAIGVPGGWEWGVLLVIGLLIFGRRLPEVGRNIGRSIVEFKRGIKGISDEIDEEAEKSPTKTIADHSQKEGLPESTTDAVENVSAAKTSEQG